MGAITRSAANNITTGGVILPAGINDASVASITELAQVSAGDGITLISSQTASNSSSISFTSGIDSSYRTYIFKLINIYARTNQTAFGFNFSTDGGSNYNVTKTTTAFNAYHNEADNEATLQYDTSNHDLAQSTGDMRYVDWMDNASDMSMSGSIILFNPSSTTFVKHFLSNVSSNRYQSYGGGFDFNYFIGGYCNTTSAVNAIIFRMSSGNFDGTIHLYGIE